LAKELESNNRGVIFAGISGYEGHTPILAPADKTRETIAAHSILREAKRLIESCGIRVNIVTGGGSCNYIDSLNTNVLTEIQAGGGVLSDALYLDKAHLRDHGHQNAVFLVTQIMSVSSDGKRAIGDAGFKATGWHPFGGLPQPFNRSDLQVIGLSAEHTKFQLNGDAKVKRGDKIVMVPGYTDAVGFLHRQLHAVRNGIVEQVWPTVSGTTWTR
jgi:D-serine deaminase-like pyridoxal phosphate-dependent protein